MSAPDYIALSAVVAALAGNWINLYLDRRKRIAERRAEVYIQYLRTFVAMSYVVGGDSVDMQRHYDHLEARAQLMLFASKSVLASLEHLYDGPPTLNDPEAGRRLASLISAMQADAQGFRSSVTSILKVVVYPGTQEL